MQAPPRQNPILLALRWLAVPSIAFLTYSGIQLLNIVGSALSLEHFLDFDSVPQLLNILIGATAFVVVGAKIAPSRPVLVAGVLWVIVLLMHIGAIYAAVQASRDEVLLWLSLPVALVGGAAGTWAIQDDERKQAEAAAEAEPHPVPVDATRS